MGLRTTSIRLILYDELRHFRELVGFQVNWKKKKEEEENICLRGDFRNGLEREGREE